MKKYKVSNSELGYEQIIMAENEQDAEIDGLVHCKEYLQEYINIDMFKENYYCLRWMELLIVVMNTQKKQLMQIDFLCNTNTTWN
jgi:hypothetical protein